MTTKHTPGPWAVRYDYVVQAPSFDGGRLVPVAQPYGVNSDGTDLFANARLISAAPELLEALESLLPMLADWHDEFPDHVGDKEEPAIKAARAAISKAKGEHQ